MKDYKELLAKIEATKKSGIDLSVEEDLAIAIMNLISLEEHFFFTGAKTGKSEYYDTLNEVREMRKALLGRMIERTEGESWCISKHLLSTTMRLMEVGTKLQSSGKKKEAEETFAYAYKAFNVFFALRLKIIQAPHVVNAMNEKATMSHEDIVKGLIDCCKE
ncbi:MAG: hypothetical protein Q8L64_04300 [bacterium]|nr:hypothetical protein [bacterium]